MTLTVFGMVKAGCPHKLAVNAVSGFEMAVTTPRRCMISAKN